MRNRGCANMALMAFLPVLLLGAITVRALAQDSVLPHPQPPFQGKIGRTVADSTPDFPKGVEAPKGAPNILLILTDDVGFGASSPFGGPIQTPTFQQPADNGLRYDMFHTTALCSPTRSALITGRNHHTNASGVITEMATGFPGYNSLIPRSSGDQGWDKIREETLARQIKLGIVPANTQLTARPADISACDTLSPDQKRLFARMMEVYAGALSYADNQIGRVVDEVRESGQLDNTLVIYIMGDNGASAEGTMQGTANEVATAANGVTESLPFLLSMIDELGGPMAAQ